MHSSPWPLPSPPGPDPRSRAGPERRREDELRRGRLGGDVLGILFLARRIGRRHHQLDELGISSSDSSNLVHLQFLSCIKDTVGDGNIVKITGVKDMGRTATVLVYGSNQLVNEDVSMMPYASSGNGLEILVLLQDDQGVLQVMCARNPKSMYDLFHNEYISCIGL